MTPLVRTIARLVAGLMFVYGVYVVLHGHLTPGGGFGGGVIVAGAFVLNVLAHGAPLPQVARRHERATRLESAGTLAYWGFALLGLLFGSFYFQNVLPRGEPGALDSAGFMPPINLAIGLEVAAGLVGVYTALLLLRRGADE